MLEADRRLHIGTYGLPERQRTAAMPTAIASHPPLDQVTIVRGQDVKFVVLLDGESDVSWQVAVWLSYGGEWEELALNRVSDLKDSVFTSAVIFQGEIKVSEKCFFTIKFRSGDDGPWQWVRNQWGTGDGVIIYNSGKAPEDSPGALPSLIQGLNPAWHVSTVDSQTPKTSVWTMTSPIEGAVDDKPTYKDVSIGLPFGGFQRWFALVRIRRPWVLPRQGRDWFDINRPALLVSFLGADGKHMVMLALSGTNDVLTLLRSDSNGAVKAEARNDGTNTQSATVIVATGDDFERAVAAVMYEARSIVMSCKAMEDSLAQELAALGKAAPEPASEAPQKEQDGEVGAQWMENWYDGIGYCTWNAFGHDVTDKDVFGALDTLAKNDIQVSSLIIDDNWQSISESDGGQYHQSWLEFEAEKESFPLGVKGTVARIRREHPNVKYVAVWHALLGYWGGVNRDGKIAHKYGSRQVEREPEMQNGIPIGGSIDVVPQKGVHQMYNDFYRFLADAGVNSVKTDVQHMMDTVVEAAPRREMLREYLNSWSIAALRHFGNRAISCMSHSPQILFYNLLPNNRPPVLFRNSGDFYPDIEASHPSHLWTNAHNAIFSSHLNVIPDWDMFQSVHDYSSFHAAARCVSGGPIYVTDIPGKHDIGLIRAMTARTVRGKTVILRPSVPGKTTDPYVGYHDKKLLKVGSYFGRAGVGASFLGLFNVSPETVVELVPFSAFPGLVSGNKYVVRTHAGRVGEPIPKTDVDGPLFPEKLPVRGWNILSATPVVEHSDDAQAHGPLALSNLGLIDKMTGAAAIVSTETKPQGKRLLVEARLKALGTLGLYISTLDKLTVEDDFMITILGQAIPAHTVTKGTAKGEEKVLRVDLETAWKELGLQSRWANELVVNVYFSL
jgi:hypothetical protein